jgi:hypothetical protein
MESLKSNIMLVTLACIALLLSTGCESLKAIDYEFGDIHRIYCGSTNQELRAEMKATLTEKGAKVDFNYCASFGLVDALVIQPIQKRD